MGGTFQFNEFTTPKPSERLYKLPACARPSRIHEFATKSLANSLFNEFTTNSLATTLPTFQFNEFVTLARDPGMRPFQFNEFATASLANGLANSLHARNPPESTNW
jgi:hypothetical protein